MSDVYADIEEWRKANPNSPEPDSHEEDMEAFGECRKCEINDPTYGYSDCPDFCEECHAYDSKAGECQCTISAREDR